MLIVCFLLIFAGPILGLLHIASLSTKQLKSLKHLALLPSLISCFGAFYTTYKLFQNNVDVVISFPYIFYQLQYSFSTNKYGLLFLDLVALLYPIATIYTLGYFREKKGISLIKTAILLHIVIFACFCVAVSNNLFTMIVFYEVITLATYPLIISTYTAKAKSAGRSYLSHLITASSLLLIPFAISIYSISGTLTFAEDGIIRGLNLNKLQINGLFFLMLFGTAKVALIPLERWLINAMIAPAPVSALIHGVVVVKSGIFVVLRCINGIFGIDLLNAYIWEIGGLNFFSWICIATIFFSCINAIASQNLKERLAYSTIGQLSYVLLMFSLFSSAGIKAGMIQFIAHSIAKVSLFFAAGAIYLINGSYSMNKITAIWKKEPTVSVAIALGCLSIIGLPPTIGFYAKYGIISAILIEHNYKMLIFVLITTIMSAIYLFDILYHVLFMSKDRKNINTKTELPFGVSASLFILSVLMLVSPYFISKLLYATAE